MTGIEHYLFLRPHWVPASELTSTFRVLERELRSRAGEPGLCSSFAISGNQGFKHIRHATEEEWTAFESRLRQHGIAELTRIKHLRERRTAHLNNTASDLAANRTFDKAGQGQLLT